MKHTNNCYLMLKIVCAVYIFSSLIVTAGCGIPLGIIHSVIPPINNVTIVQPKEYNTKLQNYDPTINGKIAVNTVAQIRCISDGRVGTGFLHKSALIITAAHVISGCPAEDIRVGRPGHDYAIKKATYNTSDDVALLYPNRNDLDGIEVFTLEKDDVLSYGEQISTWGYPEGYSGTEPLLTAGYISGLQDVPFYTKENKISTRKEWFINASVSGGMSGSPVVRVKNGGKIIGIISGKQQVSTPETERIISRLRSKHTKEDQELANALESMKERAQYNIGYVIPVSAIRKFLSRQGVDP